jgi:para-nitrobenzyl esterase
MAMPAAKGLFHRAAVMSGSHLRLNTTAVSEALTAGVLAELGITKATLDKLHQVSTNQLLDAGIAAQRKLAQAAPAGTAAPNWGPVLDGMILPQHPFDNAAPSIAAGIPLLVGNTFMEFGGGANTPDAHLLTLDQLRAKLTPTYGARTGDIVAAYQKVFPAAKPFEIWGVIQGTTAYRANAVHQAELKSAQIQAPVYMYWFGWKTPVLDGRPLAYHCQDLAFWFDNIELAAQATGGGDDARTLATKMSTAFVAFAKTGNPNHAGLPTWSPFLETRRATMVFENSGATERMDPDREARNLLKPA